MIISYNPGNLSRQFRTAGEAWNFAVAYINEFGDIVTTEDAQLTKEVRNLQLHVVDPTVGWPIPGTGWKDEKLKLYSEQFMSPENPGFDYTYGERLRRNNEVDQIVAVIKRLRESPVTRRAVMTTWHSSDLMSDLHVPCMIMDDFLMRDNKLHLTAVFRSHDIKQAWPQNVFGLYTMLKFVANEVGTDVGSITTFSVNAHIYL